MSRKMLREASPYASWGALVGVATGWTFKKPSCCSDGRSVRSYRLVRDSSEVRLVQVLFRHGARTPLQPHPGEPLPGSDEYAKLWGCCPNTAGLLSSTPTPIGRVDLATSEAAMLVSAREGSTKPYIPCKPGYLTKLGEAQLMQLGAYLRKEYLEGSGEQLLSSWLPEDGELEVFSTKTTRTILSARSLLQGLFPEASVRVLHELVQLQPESETLGKRILTPDWQRCDRLRQLYHEISHEVKQKLIVKHTWVRLAEDVGNDVEKLSLVMAGDVQRAKVGHGLPLPFGISAALASDLDACGHELVDAACGRSCPEQRRLAMGLLTAFLHRRIMSAVQEVSPLRCSLLSGHDISICGFLAALGLPCHCWPGFGSSIILELSREISSNAFFVRIVCHDGPPGIGSEVLDITVPLEAWTDVVSPLLLNESEYQEACTLPSGIERPPPQADF